MRGDGPYGTGNAGGDAAGSPSVAAPSPWPEAAGSGGFAEQVRSEVAPAVRAAGFELVALDAARLARRSLIRLVVYRADGMTADACAQLARAVRYRLALVPGAEDARLEVSTPGTTRTLKAAREFSIFRGRSVEVLVDDGWLRGAIAAAEHGIVTLDTGADERRIEFHRIRKARLSDATIDRGSDGDDRDVQ